MSAISGLRSLDQIVPHPPQETNSSCCLTDLFRSLICCGSKTPKRYAEKTTLETRIQVRPNITYITPDAREPWETGIAPLSKEQIHQSMDQLLKAWNICPFEVAQKMLESKNDEKKNEGENLLNKQIFMHMNQNYDIETPMDFVWSLQGHDFWNPLPMMTKPQNFLPEEGVFYQLKAFGLCPLGKFSKEEDPTQGYESFGCAFKREGNELFIYMDGQTEYEYLLINGEKFSYAGMNRGGSSRPSYRLKEDDLVFGLERTNRLFFVGKNGSINFPDRERQGYENEIDQTKQFNNGKMSLDERTLQYTTKKKFISEIVEPFQPGFVYYPGTHFYYEDDAKTKLVSAAMVTDEDRMIIDIEHDLILESLVDYLTQEFEVMGYSDEQKVMRIAHLSTDLLKKKPAPYENHNYHLGEIIMSGWGKCRHKTVLTKVLCNALLPHITCALVAGKASEIIPGQSRGHAWNVVELGGRHYILDCENACFVAADDLSTLMIEYYGAKHLRSSR